MTIAYDPPMLYFLALFCSPLAVLLAGRPISAILNAVLYVGAWLGLVLFLAPGVALWLMGVLHAYFVISGARADHRSSRIEKALRR